MTVSILCLSRHFKGRRPPRHPFELWLWGIFEFRRIGKCAGPAFPYTWIFGFFDFRRSGFSKFWISGHVDFRKNGCPKIWIFKKEMDLRNCGFSEIWDAGNLDFRKAVTSEIWTFATEALLHSDPVASTFLNWALPNLTLLNQALLNSPTHLHFWRRGSPSLPDSPPEVHEGQRPSNSTFLFLTFRVSVNQTAVVASMAGGGCVPTEQNIRAHIFQFSMNISEIPPSSKLQLLTISSIFPAPVFNRFRKIIVSVRFQFRKKAQSQVLLKFSSGSTRFSE